jgi:hypothetical protein
METNNKNLYNNAVISWEAPEYVQHEKGWKWFVLAGIAVLALIAYAVITSNWTLAVALIVLSAVYVWQHFYKPNHVEIIISEAGIKVGNREYPFHDIKSFWIYYNNHVKSLNLRSNSRFLPDVSIQLGDQHPTELREFLCRHLREIEGKKETFSEHLIRLLKL